MRIYTSYFANLSRHPNVIPISIALYTPRWIQCDRLLELAPTPALLQDYKANKITDTEYTDRYTRETLLPLDPVLIVDKLYAKYGYNSIALCCYEKADEFCHRHIVSKWINEGTYDIYPIIELSHRTEIRR